MQIRFLPFLGKLKTKVHYSVRGDWVLLFFLDSDCRALTTFDIVLHFLGKSKAKTEKVIPEWRPKIKP